jgi:hypothetical protein
MAVGNKLVKAIFSDGNLVITDYTDVTTAPITEQTVEVTLPGGAAELPVTVLGDYNPSTPATNPMTITPADVTAGATSFGDGVYRIHIEQETTISGTPYTLTFDERILYIPEIDNCILEKTDSYLQASCKNCKSDKALTLLQELVVVRQAAQLDLNLARYTAADKKVTLLTNLCAGSTCTCVCGC